MKKRKLALGMLTAAAGGGVVSLSRTLHTRVKTYRLQKGMNVLITGATHGYGPAFARVCVKKGLGVVIVSHRASALGTLEKELRTIDAHASVTSVCADLRRAEECEMLWDEMDARGIRVDVLIQNMETAVKGTILNTDIESLYGVLNANIYASTILSRMFLRDMVERNSGFVLTIAPLTKLEDTDKMNVYIPSKAYILSMSETLANELKDTDVHLSCFISSLESKKTDDRLEAEADKALRRMLEGLPLIMEGRNVRAPHHPGYIIGANVVSVAYNRIIKHKENIGS